jgi:hemin uptake protein HemP
MDAMPDIPATMPRPPATDLPPGQEGEARRVGSADLLAGRREVLIEHGDQTYRLRLTASNKLILVK